MENRMISDPNSDPNSDCPASPNFSPKKAPPLYGGFFGQNFGAPNFRPEAPQSIDFDEPPPVGTVVMFHGQRYEAIETEPYITKAGHEVTLIVWASHCARCAHPMTVKTTSKAKYVPRRCELCRQPGKRV